MIVNKEQADADPNAAATRPEAPEAPGPDECCHGGCTYCVEDLYQEALDKYRAELKEWLARHPS